MKFDMGSSTLATLAKNTASNQTDLGSLVKQFAAAAEPLQGKFNGEGAQRFESFKARVDALAHDLNAGLGDINTGQGGMDKAFQQGDTEMASNAASSEGVSRFDAASFGKRTAH